MNKVWKTATVLVRDFLNQDLPDDLLKVRKPGKVMMSSPIILISCSGHGLLWITLPNSSWTHRSRHRIQPLQKNYEL
jgi:hypothetical protein